MCCDFSFKAVRDDGLPHLLKCVVTVTGKELPCQRLRAIFQGSIYIHSEERQDGRKFHSKKSSQLTVAWFSLKLLDTDAIHKKYAWKEIIMGRNSISIVKITKVSVSQQLSTIQ